MKLARQPAVVLSDLCTRTSAPRVAEECEVLTARESRRLVEHRETAELDEMIAGPARAELRPGAILQPRGHTRHPPIGVHDVMLPTRSERGAHPEACLTFERSCQTGLVVRERADREVQHGQLHPARDVDADRVRDDGLTCGEHAADGEPVADM